MEVFGFNRDRARERPLRLVLSFPFACLPRKSRSFFRPLLPSACYAGYVEVALSSNFMVFPKRHYFYLVPRQGNSHTFPQFVGTVAPAPLKFEKLGLIYEPFTSNHASYST